MRSSRVLIASKVGSRRSLARSRPAALRRISPRGGRRGAAATRAACRQGATSWTRRSSTPASTQATTAASVPGSRSSTGAPVSFPMKLLREGPTRSGRPRARSSPIRARSSTLCSAVFANPSPGSRITASGRMPAAAARASAPRSSARDLRHDVAVDRPRLHVGGRAARVHEHDRGARGGDGPAELRVGEAGHVVHEVGARVERRARHRALPRVDGDREREAARPERLDHRDHAAELLLDRDRRRAGTGGLAAHVHEVGALLGEPEGVGHRGVRSRGTGRRRRTSRGSRSRSP